MKNNVKRAISLRAVDAPPIGTLGTIYPAPGFNDHDSAQYGVYVFSPDGEDVEYYYNETDVMIVADDFDPAAALEAELTRLAEDRLVLEAAEKGYKSIKRDLDRELKPYADLRNERRVTEQDCYARVALLAKAAFLKSGDRRPNEAVELKKETTVAFDVFKALRWAIENERVDLLTLDESAFVKAAKAGNVPTTIVTVHEGWKPFISSDLSHLLKDDSDEQ